MVSCHGVQGLSETVDHCFKENISKTLCSLNYCLRLSICSTQDSFSSETYAELFAKDTHKLNFRVTE
jgi:hypothetical protein